jgi:hypothetical protein
MRKLSKEEVLLIIYVLVNNKVVLKYLSEEVGEYWSDRGEIIINEDEFSVEEFISADYGWLEKEKYNYVEIEFNYNDEGILMFDLYIGKLLVKGIF